MESVVVVESEIVPKLCAERIGRGEPAAVNQIGLERMEAAFHVRVVAWGTAPSHALLHAARRQVIPKRRPTVLATAIAVKDEAGGRSATARGGREYRPRQPRIAHPCQAPREDAAGVIVHHDREVPPAPSDRQVGHVAHPHLIRRGHRRGPQAIGMLPEETLVTRTRRIELCGPRP